MTVDVSDAPTPANYVRNKRQSAERQRTVLCLPSSPPTVEEQAQQQLTAGCSYAFCFRDVDFEFADGVLTLRGRVPTFYLKQMLQTKLKGLHGVRQIDNQVDVVRTADAILPQIKRRAPNVDVVVVTGHADLEGTISAWRNGAADGWRFSSFARDEPLLRDTKCKTLTQRKKQHSPRCGYAGVQLAGGGAVGSHVMN